MNTAIIGAGPIGSYLGCLLSERGIANTIVEEHKSIGKPEQCTGLVSRNIEEHMNPSLFRKAVLNKVYGAVIGCGRASFEVKTANFKAYVLDRPELDKALAGRAENKGSELLLGHSYLNHQTGEKGLKIRLNVGNRPKILRSSLLVGADGPVSKVAKNSYLFGDRKFWTGTQVILKTTKPWFDKDMVYLFLDRKYSEGFFAWTVPIDENRAKVGLASMTRPSELMQRFLNDKFENFIVEERHAGLIPIYRKMPVNNRQKDVFLVGDAALQCKATTGGGIVNGMAAAKGLADAISSGKLDYERRIRKIRRNLWMHSMLRKRADSMSDERKEKLLEEMDNENVRKVLREKGDMDFVAGFGMKLMLAKPSLLKFLF